jgi:hypothetical protein
MFTGFFILGGIMRGILLFMFIRNFFPQIIFLNCPFAL